MTPTQLATLHRQCFHTPRPWTAEEFADLLKSPLVFLVGDARGFALGRVTLDEAELLTLAVAPAHRRAGRGRACLSGFEAAAHARGATGSFLEVATDNSAALALYRNASYCEAGRRPRYFHAPDGGKIDAVVMRKTLKPL